MGCAAVGALCLRTPDNSAGFVASGVVALFMDVLKIHKLKVAVEVMHHMLSCLAYTYSSLDRNLEALVELQVTNSFNLKSSNQVNR